MRRAIIVVLACSLLLPAGLLATSAAADPVDVPGLEGPARVDRDANGIAHIRAGSRHDLFFLQGWVHAQDRLFQMDVRRRQADGTLAELLGPAALPTDVQLRTIGLHRAAARSLPALSADAQAVLTAYADGVNAWVADNPLPPEYGALSLTSVRPWRALDSVAVGKLQSFGLSFDLDTELTTALLGYQRAGQAAGFDGTALFFQDLWRTEPFTDASTVPDATRAAEEAGGAAQAAEPTGRPPRLAAAGRLAERYAAKVAKVPLLRQALTQDRGQTGSNQWAVSGRLAAGGHPLLANDPHLGLDAPSTFYPVHLQGGETDAVGSGFAGAPGVIVGNNRFISWGATVNPMDVTDTYAEQVRPDPSSPSGLATVYQGRLEPVIPIPETFRRTTRGRARPTTSPLCPRAGPSRRPS
jgi:penicillin G amidase